jgi:hypothetical protein
MRFKTDWVPEACLGDLLTRIADHPINRIPRVLPWNINPIPAEVPLKRLALSVA